MLPVWRYAAATVVAVLALASPALAQTEVELNIETDPLQRSDITIRGDSTLATLADDITITQTSTGYTISRANNLAITTFSCTPNSVSQVTCPLVQSISIDLGAGNDVLRTTDVSTPLAIAGGSGVDTLNGGAGNDILAGNEDGDTLNGAGGVDEYFGETGADTIFSRDGLAERIACGADVDRVDNDFIDIIAECETGTDNDGDGFSTAVDCNDANRNIFPGAPDPENGIDEDCSGQDNRNLDRDRDGFPVPADCDDENAGVRPNAIEVRGNAVDENCDRRADSFAELPSLVSTSWKLGRSVTRLRRLVVRNAPAGARIRVSCAGGRKRGCTLPRARTVTVRRNLAPAFLQGLFGRGRFRAGARITVAVTASGTIGRTYTYRIERGVLPLARIVCKAPGARRGALC